MEYYCNKCGAELLPWEIVDQYGTCDYCYWPDEDDAWDEWENEWWDEDADDRLITRHERYREIYGDDIEEDDEEDYYDEEEDDL